MQIAKQIEQEAKPIETLKNKRGHIQWQSPSNIALVKYWGKKANQIPQNPSVSFSLNNSVTNTTLEFQFVGKNKFSMQYYYDNKLNASFAERVEKYLTNYAAKYLPFILKYQLIIRSENTFPHSSGIASSASFFSSLALCLCGMEQMLAEEKITLSESFYEKASFLARLGSGSACRSVYGGFNIWGKLDNVSGSTDERAIPVNNMILEKFKTIKDAICIVSSDKKQISSSEGHNLLARNPYASIRYKQAKENAALMFDILSKGKSEDFVNLVESEALALHALMMTSQPSYLLIKPNTLNIIKSVREYRKQTSIPVAFTLDAGANAHILYLSENERMVEEFLQNEIKQYCENGQIIYDCIGNGPVLKKYENSF